MGGQYGTCGPTNITMKLLLALSCLVAVALAHPQTKFEPGCQICIDIFTDIDNWITGEEQEAVVIEVLEQICVLLGQLVPSQPTLVDDCKAFMEANLPGIIEGIVSDNINPQDICNGIQICP